MKKPTGIHQIIDSKLREDLNGVRKSNGFKVGDVLVGVKQEWGSYRVWEDTFKIAVTVDYQYHLRGSHFKYVKVEPENHAEYLKTDYPKLLAKVKAAIQKLQAAVDPIKESQQQHRKAREEAAIQRNEFANTNNLHSLMDNPYDNGKYWRTKDGKLDFELHSDGTFDLDKCRAKLSLEQVKQIIAIVEVKP